jgi:hypothetical protein
VQTSRVQAYAGVAAPRVVQGAVISGDASTSRHRGARTDDVSETKDADTSRAEPHRGLRDDRLTPRSALTGQRCRLFSGNRERRRRHLAAFGFQYPGQRRSDVFIAEHVPRDIHLRAGPFAGVAATMHRQPARERAASHVIEHGTR